jgi:hypothetical protein
LLGPEGPSAAEENVVIVGEVHIGSTPTVVRTLDTTSLWGQGNGSTGVGVRGQSDSGIGVQAASSFGYGLRVARGRIKVDEVSGIATIAKGRKSVNVRPGVDINANTFILLTPNANLGSRSFWVRMDDENDRFSIRISSARASETSFGWLMIEKG